MRRGQALVLVGTLVLWGCQSKGCDEAGGTPAAAIKPFGGERLGTERDRKKIGGLGRRLLEGKVTDLRASPDGAILTALLGAQKPRLEGIPPPMRVGELWAVPTSGAEPAKKLGNGVANVGGGLLFTKDSRWALFVTGYNASSQTGELLAQDLRALKSDPVRLGGAVSYFVPSPESERVAAVEDGVLRVGALPEGPFRTVSGEVATATFAPDGKSLWFRRRVGAGGGLFAVPLDADGPKGQPVKVTDLVGDFEVLQDGRTVVFLSRTAVGAPAYDLFVADAAGRERRKLAEGVLRFALSPDERWIVWTEGSTPTQPGTLFLAAIDATAGTKIGERVRDFTFSADKKRLAFRQRYHEVQLVGEQLERVGELTVLELSSGASKVVHPVCANYLFSVDGGALAYAGTTFKPNFTRHLYLLAPGAAEPARLAEWVYEYAFAPKSDRLFYRADCSREGRACYLYSVELAKPDGGPREEGQATYHFRLSDDGARALFSFAQTQNERFDVSVLNLASRERRTIEQDIALPVYFLARDGSRIGYAVAAAGREGVYVASEGVP